MCEQGLLRMAGQKAKINDLRATFESSLYSEPEQVNNPFLIIALISL